MTLLLGAQQSFPWTTITAILSLINTLFGDKVVSASKYQLFKTLQLNDKMISDHMFCNDCLLYIGTQKDSNSKDLKCATCGIEDNRSNISFFITLDMETQLKKILQDKEVQEALRDHFEGKTKKLDNNIIEGITDGEIYKKLSTKNNPLSDNFNLTYTFNTDGCQASKSSKILTWPIYVIINELPSKLQTKHMVMCGLWINDKEPNMQTFLKPFVDEANKLSDEGFQWNYRDSIVISKFIPVCSVVDSVARCKLLNMKKFNGLHGCTFCEHPTESVDGYRKYTLSTTIPPDRTDASIKRNMELTGQSENGKSVMGVWGPSQLMNLKYFDLVDGMSPNYMHAFLLGAVKQHTDILLTSFGKEYYVGNPNRLRVINERILKFKHPTCITRSPRIITDREIWKASEWRSWLLFIR
ncbi:GSCOCG00012368001-RA-CDS [Cotesia congregata]|nr:GSCOCG00012368001-RA-CDS [Cotesia congregata]